MTRARRDSEATRLALQAELDAAKSQSERNRLGQFATPPRLASDIVEQSLALVSSDQPIRFFDPAFGTGAFYSALLSAVPPERIEAAAGFELDPHYGDAAGRFWKETGLRLHLGDFTTAAAPPHDSERFNLLICNPPYSRHHHLDAEQKHRLQAAVRQQCGLEVNGLSGLHCYFLLLVRSWMATDGLGVWLIPTEFMEVNYGVQIRRFLLQQMTLLRIHYFDPRGTQFDDALVSSAVVFVRNALPPAGHRIQLTFGNELSQPIRRHTISAHDLAHASKWTRLFSGCRQEPRRSNGRTLADLFTIKRGVATGSNSFFVLTPERIAELEIPKEFLIPILPSPRFLETDEIRSGPDGEPCIDRKRFLLTCDRSPEELKRRHPKLWAYLECGAQSGISRRYLCRHRDPWYTQEVRQPAPFLCTYMGRVGSRGPSPFRFVLNESQAIAANVYLMLYPRPAITTELAAPDVRRAVWKALSTITPEMLMDEGRSYGGGLHKIEPKELANVSAEPVLRVLPKSLRAPKQARLFDAPAIEETVP